MDTEKMQLAIDDMTKQREAASIKLGQLQEEFNQLAVKVHQLDGAIGALKEFAPTA